MFLPWVLSKTILKKYIRWVNVWEVSRNKSQTFESTAICPLRIFVLELNSFRGNNTPVRDGDREFCFKGTIDLASLLQNTKDFIADQKEEEIQRLQQDAIDKYESDARKENAKGVVTHVVGGIGAAVSAVGSWLSSSW